MRVGRIGLPSHPWQGRVLPLNHTRLRLLRKLRRGKPANRQEYSIKNLFVFQITEWARGDLNSHGLLHTLLKRTRIPIPPRAQSELCAPSRSRTHINGSEDRRSIH